MEKKTPVLVVRPNIAVALILQILKFSAIILIAIIIIGYLNVITRFNAVQFVYEMFKQTFSILMESANILSINSSEWFFYWMEDLATSHIVQAVAFFMLVLLSFITKSWTFYPDYFEYTSGNILVTKQGLPTGAIKSISYVKYSNMFNIGMLSMVVHEVEIKTIKIGFVNNISGKYEMIKGILDVYKSRSPTPKKNLENFK